MDPNTKLILDEFNWRFTELDLKLEKRVLDSESKTGARFEKLEAAAKAFEITN